MHGDRTGTGTAASGAIFKNVELGVLFHSSPERAYHTAPLPDCACPVCACSPGSGVRPHRTRTDTRELPPPPQMAPPWSIPLPVPFCLHSEAYTDPVTEFPRVRFPPYMHTLKSERPWYVFLSKYQPITEDYTRSRQCHTRRGCELFLMSAGEKPSFSPRVSAGAIAPFVWWASSLFSGGNIARRVRRFFGRDTTHSGNRKREHCGGEMAGLV